MPPSHPALVHLPVALLILQFGAALLASTRPSEAAFWKRTQIALILGGAIGAWLAAFAAPEASESLRAWPEAWEAYQTHQGLAFGLATAAALALPLVTAAARARVAESAAYAGLRLGVGAALAGLTAITSALGTELAYGYGL